MWFWWFILFCDLLIPLLMIIAGRMMWKHPPRKINCIIGYRTHRSMMNMETWNFAHEYGGKLWWKAGWITLLPSVIAHIFVYGKSDNTIAIVSLVLMTVQLIVLIGSILPTEKALKQHFTDQGVRK